MTILIYLFKFSLSFIYALLKLFPTNNRKIVFLSRQSNVVSLDFELLRKELLKEDKDLKIVILSKKMTGGLINKLKYYFFLTKQMYHIATSNVCVIDSYIIPISILKHKKSLTIIQMWHAMGAIKKFGYQCLDLDGGHSKIIADKMKMHNNYDIVISGSDTMIPYFSEAFNTSQSKFKSFGLPRMDYLINQEKSIKKRIYSNYPKLKTKESILYAPTFRKGKSNEIDNLVNEINLNKYNLIIKAHPNKKIKITDKRVFVCKEFTSLEMLSIADYIITDYSAISIEASVLNKPIYFYLYDYKEYCNDTGVNIDLYEEMRECVFENAKELYHNIQHIKYDFNKLEMFRDKYVTTQDGTSTQKIATLILEELKKWNKINQIKLRN